MARDELLRRMDDAFEEFLGSIDGLSDEQMARVWYGDWSVRDILAHVAGWHREEIAMLERIARGERPVPEGADYSDDDAWNARFAKRWRAASPADVIAELRASKEAYAAAARRLPEERFQEGRTAQRLLQNGCIDHYREHGDEIRDWRRGEGI